MRRCILRVVPPRVWGRRTKIIGQEEDEAWNEMRGVPEYAQQWNQRWNDRGYSQDDHTDFNYDKDESDMFESVEQTHGTRGHRQEFEKMTSAGLPKYTRREPVRDLKSTYLPKIGTPIVKVEERNPNAVIGWNDDSMERKRPSYSPHRNNQRSVFALYRSFWRLIYKFPVEARPKLSTTLRMAFKARKVPFHNRKEENAHIKQGRLILLRYIDALAKFERNRYTHDPVKKFLDIHAELMEQQIERLDFYPYTMNKDETKPVRDIGFHKIYRKHVSPGNLPYKNPNSGLGRAVHRSQYHRRLLPNPKKRYPIRFWHGPARFSKGHSDKVKDWAKRMSWRHVHRGSEDWNRDDRLNN